MRIMIPKEIRRETLRSHGRMLDQVEKCYRAHTPEQLRTGYPTTGRAFELVEYLELRAGEEG